MNVMLETLNLPNIRSFLADRQHVFQMSFTERVPLTISSSILVANNRQWTRALGQVKKHDSLVFLWMWWCRMSASSSNPAANVGDGRNERNSVMLLLHYAFGIIFVDIVKDFPRWRWRRFYSCDRLIKGKELVVFDGSYIRSYDRYQKPGIIAQTEVLACKTVYRTAISSALLWCPLTCASYLIGASCEWILQYAELLWTLPQGETIGKMYVCCWQPINQTTEDVFSFPYSTNFGQVDRRESDC